MVIAGSGGPISLSIPIVGSRSNKLPYDQIEIDNNSTWKRDHFRTLVTSYGNSPFFFHYRDELESLYNGTHIFLYEWNLICLNWLLEKLRLHDQIVVTNHLSHQQTGVNQLSDFYTPANYNRHEPILRYPQVFEDRLGFLPNLSALDMLFNYGPESGILLKKFHVALIQITD